MRTYREEHTTCSRNWITQAVRACARAPVHLCIHVWVDLRVRVEGWEGWEGRGGVDVGIVVEHSQTCEPLCAAITRLARTNIFELVRTVVIANVI